MPSNWTPDHGRDAMLSVMTCIANVLKFFFVVSVWTYIPKSLLISLVIILIQKEQLTSWFDASLVLTCVCPWDVLGDLPAVFVYLSSLVPTHTCTENALKICFRDVQNINSEDIHNT